MRHNLKINIIIEKEIKIDEKKIILELVKLWLNKPIITINWTHIEIIIKSFEISFNLDILDIVFYTIFKCNITNIKELNYKLSYYEDYELLFHYFLLDFNLEKEENEYLTDLLKKLVKAPYFVDKKEYLEWKIKIKNTYVINRENLYTIFLLDPKILKINNPKLKEKLIDFVLNTKSREWIYLFV